MKSAMTSSPLRVAIIGAGQVADKVHASYYCTRNDLELVAVCDSRLSQAQALADKYGNASVWDDPQAMLLAVKPDVVSVCSPNRFHYEHTLMALEAGCHVMCEKTARHDARTGAGNVRYRAQTGQGAGLRLSPPFCARYATAA
ncbi:oxidoreductase, NADH-binding [Escherichia coli]|uniref:Oxidoreductase, NADH-binding n=1 Tax=Escherichia coli TaxID=562 RepID=A0A2X3LUX8_ECOLX|nr:oxidoreductase, NADH-binding [Escherichia coli]